MDVSKRGLCSLQTRADLVARLRRRRPTAQECLRNLLNPVTGAGEPVLSISQLSLVRVTPMLISANKIQKLDKRKGHLRGSGGLKAAHRLLRLLEVGDRLQARNVAPKVAKPAEGCSTAASSSRQAAEEAAEPACSASRAFSTT